MRSSKRNSGGSSGVLSCSTKAAVCAASNGLGTMPICSRSSTWACVFGAPVSRASVASMAFFCRGDGAPFSTVRFWEVGCYPCLSARGGGARAAAVDRDRERASLRPSSGANPDIPSLREHWLRTKYASRKALSCLSRGKSCRLALRAARAARCAIFTAVASYKERCWKKTGLFACGVSVPAY